MNMSMNTLVNVLKENMTNVINNSQVPIGVVYYVLKDLLSEVEDVYSKTLKKESQETLEILEKEEQEKEDVKEHQE